MDIFLEPGQSPPAPYDPETGFRGYPDKLGEMWTRPNPKLSYINDIFMYALTVEGYRYAPEYLGTDCGDLANERLRIFCKSGRWQGSFDELRCCLFFEQRRYRHFAENPKGDDLDAIMALHAAICEAWDREVKIVFP